MVVKKSLFAWVLERYRGLQLLLFAMIVATIFFRVFPLEMQKRIINMAIGLKKLDALFLYCGLYMGAVSLAGALKYAINVLQGYIGQKILLDMRDQLYRHILTLPLSFFRRTPPGMVIASLTSELSVIGEFMGGAIATPVINILTLVAFAAYIVTLSPMLAVVTLSLYPVEVLVVPFLQKRFNLFNQQRIDITRSMSNVIGEAVSGMHEVHGNASYNLEGDRLNAWSKRLFTIRCRMNTTRFLIKFVNNFFQSLGPFLLFLLGGYLTINGRLDLGALVAFLSAHEKLYDPWKELMDYYQSFQDSRVRYEQVMRAFDVKPEFALLPPPGHVAGDPISGAIQVQDLSLVVEDRITILDGVSLDLQAGQRLALVGFSGSGKSSLAMVLGQLYSYSGGHVLLDGHELKTLSKTDVSRHIGFVAQYPFVFDGTLLENILYSCRAIEGGCGSVKHDADGRKLTEPERVALLGTLQSVGFLDDVLRLGLSSPLPEEYRQELGPTLVQLRESFMKRWGEDLGDVIDFFDPQRFQFTNSVGANIIFGYPTREAYAHERVFEHPRFKRFLSDTDLVDPLVELGAEIAAQTVTLLQDIQDDAFFFRMSPISQGEFEQYSDIVARIPPSGTLPEPLAHGDEEALLRLALRFVPARHKMASLSPFLVKLILEVRPLFMTGAQGYAPGAFAFIRPDEHLFTQSIMENILFGHVKADNPRALEESRERVLTLLQEEGLIGEVMEVGLHFQVGSKGDRLSGGQKQKIGIVRALLKQPRVLILDEATASLDNASQARIQQLLNVELKGTCTIVAVVHRLELVKDYDIIAVMKEGKIIEMGSYDQLMTAKGVFHELARGE